MIYIIYSNIILLILCQFLYFNISIILCIIFDIYMNDIDVLCKNNRMEETELNEVNIIYNS